MVSPLRSAPVGAPSALQALHPTVEPNNAGLNMLWIFSNALTRLSSEVATMSVYGTKRRPPGRIGLVQA
jgi:hypothetical protein